VHLLLAPLSFPSQIAVMKSLAAPVEAAVRSLPPDPALAAQDPIVVNAPGTESRARPEAATGRAPIKRGGAGRTARAPSVLAAVVLISPAAGQGPFAQRHTSTPTP
jgi:hypothetical protein